MIYQKMVNYYSCNKDVINNGKKSGENLSSCDSSPDLVKSCIFPQHPHVWTQGALTCGKLLTYYLSEAQTPLLPRLPITSLRSC